MGVERLMKRNPWLKSFLDKKFLPSLILWGPPGTGKTSLALILSQHSGQKMISINAVETGAKELKQIGEDSRNTLRLEGKRTLLFVDEIHRLNKSQQDVLLPFVEKGEVTLIGATTENPSYEINRALLSRCRLVVVERLTAEDLKQILSQAIGLYKMQLSEDSIAGLVTYADGDARRLLNAIEILGNASVSEDANINIWTWEQVQDILFDKTLAYDKNSDLHYDLVSAMIKSLRGSDPDAAMYYFVRMLEGGEDPKFIARRLIIFASEDVGNADPKAMGVAADGFQAFEKIGLPEGAICLAQVVTYLATAPKSNRSYKSLRAAQEFVRQTGSLPVPLKLRSSQTSAMKALGYGQGYKYPHDFPKSFVEENYWPEGTTPQKFYEPKEFAYEKHIVEYLKWLKN
jgi:putative ATPase